MTYSEATVRALLLAIVEDRTTGKAGNDVAHEILRIRDLLEEIERQTGEGDLVDLFGRMLNEDEYEAKTELLN